MWTYNYYAYSLAMEGISSANRIIRIRMYINPQKLSWQVTVRVNDYISIFLDYGLQHWHRIPHIILDQNIWMLPNDERKIISTLVCHKINFKFGWYPFCEEDDSLTWNRRKKCGHEDRLQNVKLSQIQTELHSLL